MKAFRAKSDIPLLYLLTTIVTLMVTLVALTKPESIILFLGGVLFILIVGAAYVVFRMPVTAIIIYLMLIPVHFLIYRVLYNYVSPNAASLMAIWKEVLLIFSLVACFRYKYVLRVNILDLLIILFIVYQLFFFLNDISNVALRGLLNNTRFLLLYLIVRWSRPDYRWSNRILRSIIIVDSFIVITGVLQWLIIPSIDLALTLGWDPANLGDVEAGGFQRAISILLAANELGQTASILLLALVIMYPKEKGRRHITWWLMISITLASLLLSLSRSSWLGTICGLSVISLYNRKIRSYLLMTVLVFIVLSPLAVSLYDVSSISIVQRLLAAFDPSDSSTRVRLEALPRQLNAISDHPFGLGLGTASRASIDLERSDILYSESNYLQMAIETGWIGIFLLTSIVLVTATALHKRVTHVASDQRTLVYWAISAWVSISAAALVFPALGYMTPPAQAAILVGIAMNLPTKSNEGVSYDRN